MISALLLLALLLFASGVLRLRRRADDRSALARKTLLFGAGWTLLALTRLTPLHELGARSFTLHMVEHELIMLPGALLLALARPLGVMLWAVPDRARRRLVSGFRNAGLMRPWHMLSDPLVATALQASALWLWHAPGLFNRALASHAWHTAQHLSFFATALLFWSSLVIARRGPAVGAFCLFVTSLTGGALGALMSLATSPWYAAYALRGMAPFGLTPAEDQQLAGLLMWVPGGTFHALAALLVLARKLTDGEAPGRGGVAAAECDQADSSAVMSPSAPMSETTSSTPMSRA